MENNTSGNDTERTLREVLESLEEQVKKQVSFKQSFLRGLLYGLGIVVGTTILIALLSWFLGTIGLDWVIEFFQAREV